MHPDLSPHLHSEECNQLIRKLQECHEENRVGRVFGVCNALDASVLKCLRKERADNARQNREAAELKRAKWRQKPEE